jgi:hypothetical protein
VWLSARVATTEGIEASITTSTGLASHRICIPHHRKYACYTTALFLVTTTHITVASTCIVGGTITYSILLTDIDLPVSNVASPCLIYFNLAVQCVPL